MSEGLHALENLTVAVLGSTENPYLLEYYKHKSQVVKKELRALEMIKEKHVDCFLLVAIFNTTDNIEHYNQNYGKEWQLTQEEYKLLKEVLG